MSGAVIAGTGDGIVASGPSFQIREWAHGPNDGPPLHVHHSDDEAWHVLDGVLRFRFTDRTAEAGPGTTVFAPAGTPHTYGALSDVRYLIISTERVFDLIDALHEADSDDARAIFRRFDSEVLE